VILPQRELRASLLVVAGFTPAIQIVILPALLLLKNASSFERK
jgi:hypothetical protein